MPQTIEPDADGQLFDLITESRREYLRRIAICALKRYFRNSQCQEAEDEKLRKIMAGVFVTIKQNGDLRGCIGYVTPTTGLVESVGDVAVMAATEDPRFLPLTSDDIEKIELEITVLGAPKLLINSSGLNVEPVEIGKHGLIVESPFGRGLLLPQVALEWGFSREEFLEATCIKAGLKRDCWKNVRNRVYYFDALSF